MKFAIPVLAAALLVAGCNEEPAPEAPQTAGDDDRTAEGDVLEGSISDAMLPLDQVQSQSPPMAGSSSDGDDSSDDEPAED